MTDTSILKRALGSYIRVPQDWMPATQVRPFILEDPGSVWLKFYGKNHGLFPDKATSYEFSEFIFEKGNQFEEKWIKEIAGKAVRVCQKAYDVASADRVRETFELMKEQTPIISQPAFWWAPEKIYGVPDLLIHTSWLLDNQNISLDDSVRQEILDSLKNISEKVYYLIFDIKFTTKLDEGSKEKDLQNYTAQVKIYSYMLGHLQGLMPPIAFIVSRDRIFTPMPVKISSQLYKPLDQDLTEIREQFLEIKLNGDKYLPWRDEIVAIKLGNDDEWGGAKEKIALELVPGKDSRLLYQIGVSAKNELATFGFSNIDSMIDVEPDKIPFEKCRGLGAKKSMQIRAVLKANRTGHPVLPAPDFIPGKKKYEFFVDFEYFTNVNVDFEKEWPDLEGREMIFMIGVGFEENDKWSFKTFIAEKEDQQEELKMIENFIDFLKSKTDGDVTNAFFYHWSPAEVSQLRGVVKRHQLPSGYLLSNLNWFDLRKIFLDGPASIPGAWGFGLKEVAKALARYYPEYDSRWPGELAEGLRAMVMGWKAYKNEKPLGTQEMEIITQYLEADCRALRNVLKWLRSSVEVDI